MNFLSTRSVPPSLDKQLLGETGSRLRLSTVGTTSAPLAHRLADDSFPLGGRGPPNIAELALVIFPDEACARVDERVDLLKGWAFCAKGADVQHLRAQAFGKIFEPQLAHRG